MHPASEHHIPDGLIAANLLLSEKPRLGFRAGKCTVHQGLEAAKSLNRIGDTTTVVRYSWQVSLMAQQQVSQAGQDFIKGYEKLRLSPYDANPGHGDMTIGYGHKIKKGETFGTITQAEAENLFASDVATMASHVSGDLKVGVTQNQFDALVSLRFNAGPYAITPPVADLNSTGHATMGDFTNHYITAQGVFMQGLANRRAAEWNIFSKGIYDSTH